uniref:Uncharacterized protein n=1 Tax=Mycena chlorophos TaxID=658473 RepID=A0ABQ0LEI6_MYCCL|nr:predicted protein [Mycena chlorophos]
MGWRQCRGKDEDGPREAARASSAPEIPGCSRRTTPFGAVVGRHEGRRSPRATRGGECIRIPLAAQLSPSATQSRYGVVLSSVVGRPSATFPEEAYVLAAHSHTNPAATLCTLPYLSTLHSLRRICAGKRLHRIASRFPQYTPALSRPRGIGERFGRVKTGVLDNWAKQQEADIELRMDGDHSQVALLPNGVSPALAFVSARCRHAVLRGFAIPYARAAVATVEGVVLSGDEDVALNANDLADASIWLHRALGILYHTSRPVVRSPSSSCASFAILFLSSLHLSPDVRIHVPRTLFFRSHSVLLAQLMGFYFTSLTTDTFSRFPSTMGTFPSPSHFVRRQDRTDGDGRARRECGMARAAWKRPLQSLVDACGVCLSHSQPCLLTGPQARALGFRSACRGMRHRVVARRYTSPPRPQSLPRTTFNETILIPFTPTMSSTLPRRRSLRRFRSHVTNLSPRVVRHGSLARHFINHLPPPITPTRPRITPSPEGCPPVTCAASRTFAATAFGNASIDTDHLAWNGLHAVWTDSRRACRRRFCHFPIEGGLPRELSWHTPRVIRCRLRISLSQTSPASLPDPQETEEQSIARRNATRLDISGCRARSVSAPALAHPTRWPYGHLPYKAIFRRHFISTFLDNHAGCPPQTPVVGCRLRTAPAAAYAPAVSVAVASGCVVVVGWVWSRSGRDGLGGGGVRWIWRMPWGRLMTRNGRNRRDASRKGSVKRWKVGRGCSTYLHCGRVRCRKTELRGCAISSRRRRMGRWLGAEWGGFGEVLASSHDEERAMWTVPCPRLRLEPRTNAIS